ncbi:MAG: multicopper oxidase domain-containing protein [Plasticicumulans sp.]
MMILPKLPARLALPAALALALAAVPLAARAAMPEPMAAMHCEHHPDQPACGPATTLPDTTSAPAASAPAVVELADGAFYVMRAAPVTKTIDGVALRLFAYNGSVPGPLLKVRQGTQVTIGFENAIDQPSTIHWHGLRVDYREDGTPGIGQPAVPPGSRTFYRLRFPDEGLYWYHPHVREDYQQDAGLYGNVWVLPADSAAYAPVAQEIPLLLDDILIENGAQVPWGRVHADHAIKGRYGNVRLVNGETAQQFSAKAGDRVRLYLTNAANVRNFRLKMPGQKLRLVGSDGGRTERETLTETLLLSPSERAIVEIQFPRAGSFALYDDTPAERVKLASFEVSGDAPADAADPALRDNPLMSSDLERLQAAVAAEPKFQLTMDVRFGGPGGGAQLRHGRAADDDIAVAPAGPAAPSLPKRSRCPIRTPATAASAPVPVDPADSHKQKLETAADAHAGHEHGSALPPAAAAAAERDAAGLDDRQHRRQPARRRPGRNETGSGSGSPGRTGDARTGPRGRSACRARWWQWRWRQQWRRSPPPAGADRVGGRHAGRQRRVQLGRGALAAARRQRRREHGRALALHRRRAGEDPPRQPDERRTPDAAPDPLPRPALRRHRHRRQAGGAARVEGHGAGTGRLDDRHRARPVEPRRLDGPLPHRRAPQHRHDDRLHSGPEGTVRRHWPCGTGPQAWGLRIVLTAPLPARAGG